jgi:hypothetical protein
VRLELLARFLTLGFGIKSSFFTPSRQRRGNEAENYYSRRRLVEASWKLSSAATSSNPTQAAPSDTSLQARARRRGGASFVPVYSGRNRIARQYDLKSIRAWTDKPVCCVTSNFGPNRAGRDEANGLIRSHQQRARVQQQHRHRDRWLQRMGICRR